MGSANDKPRKPHRHLAEVPKYEEPNLLPLPGIGGGSSFGLRYGRFGHGSDDMATHRPAWPGRLLLAMLGMKPKRREQSEPTTREHEPATTSGEGTIPRLPN
jgi:hypothetical protein